MKAKPIIVKTITILTIVIVFACAFYIMANRLGLNDQLDFGAGAYYYTDIPNHEQIVREDVFESKLPYWVHVLLFLSWGWLMYRLWVYIDNRNK